MPLAGRALEVAAGDLAEVIAVVGEGWAPTPDSAGELVDAGGDVETPGRRAARPGGRPPVPDAWD